jgi:peroxiredoxin
MRGRKIRKRTVRWMSGACALLALLWSAGCSIEKAEKPRSGAIEVTLTDTSRQAITGAMISIDGQMSPRRTPAIIDGLSEGTHDVFTYKPGYYDANINVDVRADVTIPVHLMTYPAAAGSIELVGAPDGTTLIVNNVKAGTIPVAGEYPNIFSNLGIGTFRVSAYLTGCATEMPAQWTVQLAPTLTIVLNPLFTHVPVGTETGQLAPSFALPSDWDSTGYSLQDYRGQVVLVTFFFYNCTACAEEFPYIAEAYHDPAYAGKVQFLGVDFADSYATFHAFRDDHRSLGVDFPLVHDRFQQTRSDYNIISCPANFVVDQTGRIVLATGGISEPQLRQTLDQLLQNANSATFSLHMQDTLLNYAKQDSIYSFHGVLTNRLAAQRQMVFVLEPVQGDTSRQWGLCALGSCRPQRSGWQRITVEYPPNQVDSLIEVSIYNSITDWSTGFPLPADSALHGDYALDFSAYPVDNSAEIIHYRLHFHDAAGGSAVAWHGPLISELAFKP